MKEVCREGNKLKYATFRAAEAIIGLGLLLFKLSILLSLTCWRLVRLLWKSARSVAGKSGRQHTTLSRNRHTWPPAGFELAIPASKQPQIHTLDRVEKWYFSFEILSINFCYLLSSSKGSEICSCYNVSASSVHFPTTAGYSAASHPAPTEEGSKRSLRIICTYVHVGSIV